MVLARCSGHPLMTIVPLLPPLPRSILSFTSEIGLSYHRKRITSDSYRALHRIRTESHSGFLVITPATCGALPDEYRSPSWGRLTEQPFDVVTLSSRWKLPFPCHLVFFQAVFVPVLTSFPRGFPEFQDE